MRHFDSDIAEILACPDDHFPLKFGSEGLVCTSCQLSFPERKGIPMLFGSHMRKVLLGEGMVERVAERVAIANRNFHDLNSSSYDEKHANDSFSLSSQQRIKSNLKYATKGNNINRLLDLGCGTGNILRNSDAHMKVGVDISVDSVARALAFTPYVFAVDACQLPFANESFNAVTAFSVLHHIVNIEELLKEAYRVLTPGGFFYTDWDPNRDSEIFRLARAKILSLPFVRNLKPTLKQLWKKETPATQTEAKREYELANYHEGISSWREFNPRILRKSLKKIGFRNGEVWVFNHRPQNGQYRHFKYNSISSLLHKRFMTISWK